MLEPFVYFQEVSIRTFRSTFTFMLLYVEITYSYWFLQYFDIVGWATGRASGLYKVWCWFVGGDI